MSRIVAPSSTDVNGLATGGDPYGDRVAKYIPAEFVATYLAAQSLVSAAANSATLGKWLLVVVGLVLLIVLPVYIRRKAAAESKPWRMQSTISSIAFVIWVYALGVLPTLFGFYEALVGGIVVLMYSFLVGVFQPTAQSK
ncbi:MAG: hypothetical protein WKF57_22335 [Nakamurella sp.]